MPHPSRFSYIEAIPSRSLSSVPNSLRISPTTSHKSLIIRLLTGTLNFKCEVSGEIFKQRNNYSLATMQKNKGLSKQIIKNSVSNFANLIDLDTHLFSTATQNNKFYREILFEFTSYFFRREKGHQISAFINLYRILESSALCFPLIWASRARDYEKTFNDLKTFFEGTKTQELGVLRRFLRTIVDPNISAVPIKLMISAPFPDWQKRYFNIIEKQVDSAEIVSQTQFSDVTVKFGALTNLTVNIRNRYFHFLTGKGDSFGSEDIPDPNGFFSLINEPILNWLGILFFEILSFEFK